jgi:glycosyltransferase involved in cell wall biosynthesis
MIHIFQRHCNTSANSVDKERPEWFSREKCLQNLLSTIEDSEEVNLTIMFDGVPNPDHFINNYQGLGIVKIKGGTDGHSFLNVVNYVSELKLNDNDIIYFLEDDYMHQPGWIKIMLEGFNSINVDYITLYDHKDKYFLPGYNSLQSKVIATQSIHWRTTPSTTNTYACRFSTFRKHLAIHKEYCDLEKGYTRDHDKFIRLWQEGSNLISCIPGYSTHVETPYLSPVVDWGKISYLY